MLISRTLPVSPPWAHTTPAPSTALNGLSVLLRLIGARARSAQLARHVVSLRTARLGAAHAATLASLLTLSLAEGASDAAILALQAQGAEG